ncbi:hypothetical protein LCGC14_0548300 [marine sediment metagenome]|uniref:Uncharacterized protein n=1 Tax=marine sediment metagenome TaxID=412755 RepID=A0A0F9RVI8_9ZZZZ
MKFTKEQNKSIKIQLWKYFQPIHKHLGLENSSDIEEITEHIIKKCRLSIKEYYKKLIFKGAISSKIFNILMNEKSPFYIKGLDCEVVYKKGNGLQNRMGHYYIVKDKEDARRIKEKRDIGIRDRQKGSYMHDLHNKEFLKQLGHDSNIDRKQLRYGNKKNHSPLNSE